MTIATIREMLDVLTGSELRAPAAARRRAVRGFSTDTRSLKKGEAFIALVGDQFDGHDFLAVAAERGASVAVVAAGRIDRCGPVPDSLPLLVVEDTLVAYGAIATTHRDSFDIPVIAIAGSNGKTTTKELVADVLATRHTVLRTEGNLNNLIGVPATMLRLDAEHTAAVIEIGTNMPGEIEQLCRILKPTHGLITNIGREHLELLGSLDGVAEEEGALFRWLAEHGGTAFVNVDDPYVARMARRLPGAITYGKKKSVRFVGRVGPLDERGAPSLEVIDTGRESAKPLRLQLSSPGVHTASNALAAAAVGLTMKVAPTKVARALEAFEPRIYKAGYARLSAVKAAVGATILNDTYNANPDSVTAALATLKAMKPGRGGRRIAVLAEMKELGVSSADEHARVGSQVANPTAKVDVVLFHGDEMRHAHRAVVATGSGSRVESRFFDRKEELIDTLAAMVTPADIVLVKGSRGMTMEMVVAALTSHVRREVRGTDSGSRDAKSE